MQQHFLYEWHRAAPLVLRINPYEINRHVLGEKNSQHFTSRKNTESKISK